MKLCGVMAIAAVIGSAGLPGGASEALAQGQDSTRAERNAQVISRLIEGRYDNANQVYFEKRLGEPEEAWHDRYHLTVSLIAEESRYVSWLDLAFQPDSESPSRRYLARLSPQGDGKGVRMTFYEPAPDVADARPLESCDLVWHEEAGQFRGASEGKGCEAETPRLMMLSEDQLWFAMRADRGKANALERARLFQCYMDVPGVGGGRDIPYRRYELGEVHDRGGKAEITLEGGEQFFVRLQNVRWPINNLENIFTRHSMVLYVGETRNGESSEIAYTWTQPKAQRIGLNLKSLLVNCFMLSNEEIEPFYRDEPEF